MRNMGKRYKSIYCIILATLSLKLSQNKKFKKQDTNLQGFNYNVKVHNFKVLLKITL